MRHIKTYQVFEASASAPAPLTQEQIEWLEKGSIGIWLLNPQTGLVDVKGDFNCSDQGLIDFKGVKFGMVDDSFYCGNNALTSLVGAPQEVGHDFDCRNNQLTSLVGAPQEVGHDFDCMNNQLTSLMGAPQEVGRDFDSRNNALTSLVGAPQVINGSFDCGNNALASLEGAPHKVGKGFWCDNNRLTSLIGAPLKVDGGFSCDDNPVSEETLDAIFIEMKKGTGYLAAVKSLWSKIPQDDQVLLYADDFKWVTPEQSRGLVALRAYQGLRGML